MTNIRTTMRQKRAALSPSQINDSAQRIAFLFTQHKLFKQAKTLGSFIGVNGEQNPSVINQIAQQKSKQVLLPVVQNFTTRLAFGPQESPRILNKFNIPEPGQISAIPLWTLDIVLVPLTAFDAKGNRVGMGGGFYDRTFDFIKFHSKRPFLIGVAHSFQKTVIIKPQPWDIPLDGILTENEFTLF